MKRDLLVMIGTSAALAACGQQAPDNGASNQAANAAQTVKKKNPYCFFKDEEMKGWSASRDDQGNIRIRLKAHVKDPRYKAVVGQLALAPTKAILFPTISPNTGYATPDNWWDIGGIVPNSGSVNQATVQCGDKVIATMTVKPKG